MKYLISLFSLCLLLSAPSYADYQRNKAVPVQQVLFGSVQSVRNITEQELVKDQTNGWKTFGGALLGGVVGNQFGGGSGRTVATILGSMIGGSIAHNRQQSSRYIEYQLVELMIQVESGEQYMVVQDKDSRMIFNQGDKVRLVYLSDNTVRVDKAF
ncbi:MULTISPECIES: glycine zipper 2TM domain-containing protein [Pseudoalteromonas]|jgi:outer membrane lipoprotein SlyB|uniref:Glycine zipper 2TM domain-containing protein n=1 Tax=Pseudoalteromonas lipolytica TaxID=570156 RepID=A0AAD0S048_9GAMM|nr:MULTISPECIES: glycine zipper 2TM domain-containing protein [Pseudoalteromonas]AXV65039.1 glycine zipper 2TM domain-containing protein [Pseudoalteromonas donghaensis]EWH07331.1 membrane protein [Pseudoalteromonas lipolytica SCSIO 04301]MBE0351137.1 outer membrane lipoprotein SlyB [Pseudoalteromonas lipolytica LMEB 39]QMW15754.1 glycine zipper 2TM domain-containing protein [Pseudoalteromonas sp. MT33b]QPL44137.1 glycine zipper 2TM domain-containing protein [Pseudoalteromonas sp. A41-2]